eukprot:gb/GECH01013212.1/.p1 GENE.gb/GECH01013212.1/~~gb/GECH01013212.1/.p1  ORF type:complete len:156 (+),score=35.28 gb/GECH01013212.1/:1-468(+)
MIINFIRSRVTGKNKVGRDLKGNKYYTRETATGEKRIVTYRRGAPELVSGVPDPNDLPVEWQSWLSYRRATPPTIEEQEQLRDLRKEIQRRAKEWEEKDQRLRLQEMAQKARGEFEAGPGSMLESLEKAGQELGITEDNIKRHQNKDSHSNNRTE